MFLAGAFVTLLFTQIIPAAISTPAKKTNNDGKVLGVSNALEENKSVVEDSLLKQLTVDIVGDLLGNVTENPMLAPIFKTKEDIENTVTEVQNLPEAQKAAVCQEICSVK